MSWTRLNFRGGVLKIKPRWQMRSAERDRRVPMLDLGIIIISWWNRKALELYEPATLSAKKTPPGKPDEEA